MPLKRRDFLKSLSAGMAGAAAFIGLKKAGATIPTASRARRLVLVKIDGLPQRLIDEFANETDPVTGKSRLPWVKHLFYENGARLNNFYVRGMSLSAPSWSMLDTGQHLQIKGNVEFDRLTLHAYDYLNFIPFYFENLAQQHADMPGVEILDEVGNPLLLDAYSHRERYQGFQTFQRGVHWSTFQKSVKTRLERFRGTQEVIDEWTTNGLELRNFIQDQLERDLIVKLADPQVRYLDYYTTDVDHRTHHNRDRESQLAAIREVDATIGRIWTGVEKSSLAKDTVLVLVSDHGTNTDPNVISQGYNLVKLLGSLAGGGHHVITKRRLMMDYSLKSIYPLVPLITTTTDNSFYLKGQSTDYPTALLDFDGNERSAIHLRNSDLNVLHILLQQLRTAKPNATTQRGATDLFFAVIDRNRDEWQMLVTEMNEELAALRTVIEKQRAVVAALPKKWTKEDLDAGRDQDAHRESARLGLSIEAEKAYSQYLPTLTNLLALRKDEFNPAKIKIPGLIAKGAMGQPNTIHQLQNYVVGLSPQGLILRDNGTVDTDKSFVRVNYFPLIRGVTVRNNVQPAVSNEPIDFVAARLNPRLIDGLEDKDVDTIVWIYKDEARQALILSHTDGNRGLMLRYLPVSRLQQTADGRISFTQIEWRDGLPFRIWEDPKLRVPDDREIWFKGWHTEHEWVAATHRTDFSTCVVGINEHFSRHVAPAIDTDEAGLSPDERLLRRLRKRRRRLVEPDLFIHASNHWNFDVRGFNPGGNHGSFYRVSTNATLMFSGGDNTGVPRGLAIEEPYDSLDLIPTLFQLTGDADEGRPSSSLTQKGFRQFPGRLIRELFK